MAETLVSDPSLVGVTSPTIGPDGALLVASSTSGDVQQVDAASGAVEPLFNTGGAPSSLAFDGDGTLIVCDAAHATVFEYGKDQQLRDLVKEYEAKPFKGPSALALDSASNIFFCDSGPLGETTLQRPKGSVFMISAEGQLLQPLVLESLAHPCALALAPDEGALYVAEMMQNRLLRLVQKPAGAWHCSVFFQFSGRVGPSGIAVDQNGNLFVSRYDVATSAGPTAGVVSVISPEGKLLSELAVPAPEVTGVAISGGTMFVTEASTGSVYKLPVPTGY
jgi:aspartate beta-hydroxylase